MSSPHFLSLFSLFPFSIPRSLGPTSPLCEGLSLCRMTVALALDKKKFNTSARAADPIESDCFVGSMHIELPTRSLPLLLPLARVTTANALSPLSISAALSVSFVCVILCCVPHPCLCLCCLCLCLCLLQTSVSVYVYVCVVCVCICAFFLSVRQSVSASVSETLSPCLSVCLSRSFCVLGFLVMSYSSTTLWNS